MEIYNAFPHFWSVEWSSYIDTVLTYTYIVLCCINLLSLLKWQFSIYMCTLNCPFCVFTIYNCASIHSVISRSILIRYICPFVRNWLLLIMHVFVHYSGTWNVFQEFQSCSSLITHNNIIKQVNKHPTVQDLRLISV